MEQSDYPVLTASRLFVSNIVLFTLVTLLVGKLVLSITRTVEGTVYAFCERRFISSRWKLICLKIAILMRQSGALLFFHDLCSEISPCVDSRSCITIVPIVVNLSAHLGVGANSAGSSGLTKGLATEIRICNSCGIIKPR